MVLSRIAKSACATTPKHRDAGRVCRRFLSTSAARSIGTQNHRQMTESNLQVPLGIRTPFSGPNFANDPNTVETYKFLQEAVEANLTDFGVVKEGRDMDPSTFEKFMGAIVPSMGKEEVKALFTSMDDSGDGAIQPCEIFSDLTLSTLRNRMRHPVQHPLEGSYHCLPKPPFRDDSQQVVALGLLKTVFDEVIEAHAKPLPKVEAVKPEESGAGVGVFASMFGGVRKTKGNVKRAAIVASPPPNPNAPKGAYIHGVSGCGKTVLLDLFFRSLPQGFTARRMHGQEFIRDAFRSMQGQPPGDNVFVAMAEMMSTQFRVLLLDELLITHISEAILVKSLFRHMWARGMTIIITSNYLPNELYAKGFNRDQFTDFIPDLEFQCPVVQMGGQIDYRKADALSDTNHFLYPLDAATKEKFNKIFDDSLAASPKKEVPLTTSAVRRPLTVPVAGLDIRGATVARFSFSDLCDANLCKVDYNAIVENYRTIFMDGVPKFRPDLCDQFRRFVTFIDILYGKKSALFLQSEVHSNELFADGMLNADVDIDDLWAFRRCSSLLVEMQTPKYNHMVWLMRNHMLQEPTVKR